MNRRKALISVLVVAILLALPATALANKKLYKARLSTANEVHTVVGSSATGSMVLTVRPEGIDFMLSIRGLSGPATGIHLHGPAAEGANAGVIVTLCGAGPGTPVSGACPAEDANGFVILTGHIGGQNLVGIGPGALQDMLDGGLVYVNAHTDLNPAGETRGQLILQ